MTENALTSYILHPTVYIVKPLILLKHISISHFQFVLGPFYVTVLYHELEKRFCALWLFSAPAWGIFTCKVVSKENRKDMHNSLQSFSLKAFQKLACFCCIMNTTRIQWWEDLFFSKDKKLPNFCIPLFFKICTS